VWTDGQQGEDNDYFADHCDGVTVTIAHTVSQGYYYLTGLTSTEKNLLKKCLGASDFDSSNNVEVYNWDYGNELYPHIIKLVRTQTVYTDGGYFAVIWYDTSIGTLDSSGETTTTTTTGHYGTFRLLNPFQPPDAFATDNYEVYTTKGTLALTSNMSQAVFSFASKNIYITNSSYDVTNGAFDGDISCEIGNNNAYKMQYINHCLNKTDLFTLLSWDDFRFNPPHINLYTANRIYTTPYQHLITDRDGTTFSTSGIVTTKDNYELHYMTHVINSDLSTNWAAYNTKAGYSTAAGTGSWFPFRVYKFFPATASTYNYVNECSNRGICARDTGLCNCFPGYTNDDCSVQNSISL